MSFRIGLTGSIGMGKSSTARLFAEEGCAVWDADAAVHRLYARDGAAVAHVGAAFPGVVIDGAVDRERLRAAVLNDPAAIARLEKIVHPLVASDRDQFAGTARADILVFDIPLLFETGADAGMDATVCVTVPAEEQRRRVLERGGMSGEQLDAILARQMPDAEKRERADFVVVTDTVEHAREQVQDVLEAIRERMRHA